MVAQIKVVSDTSEITINAVKSGHGTNSGTNHQSTANKKPLQECWNVCVHMSIIRKSYVLPMARHAISVKNQTTLQPNIVARLEAVGDTL